MGAGARADPTRIRVADLRESSNDPLSRAVRHRLKKDHGIEGGIPVVFSLEKPKAKLLPFQASKEEETPSDYQVDAEDVMYIVKELWHGRSARDQSLKDIGRKMWRSVNELMLVRWDKSKPAGVSNLILLKFSEADAHESTTLDRIKEEEPWFCMCSNELKQSLLYEWVADHIGFLRLLYSDNCATFMDQAGGFQFWGGLISYIACEEASR